MALRDYTKLKNVSQIGENGISNDLEDNLYEYYNWAFLSIGNFVNVDIPTSGVYGGDFSTLRRVKDPSYTNGQVWEAARKDWVWETGLEYLGAAEPNQITGVMVNGTTYGPSDLTYGFEINYPLGRIIFDTAISTSATVKLEYAYKPVQFYNADDAPWLQEIQFSSFRPDSAQFTQDSSGIWSIGSQHRIQMPCIVIEAIAQGRSSPRGYQLGDGSLYIHRHVCFHICAESKQERNRYMDFIANNVDKAILLVDCQEIASNEDIPLDYNGALQANPKMYPQLVEEYNTRKCDFIKADISEVRTFSPYFHFATVKVLCEVILPDV